MLSFIASYGHGLVVKINNPINVSFHVVKIQLTKSDQEKIKVFPVPARVQGKNYYVCIFFVVMKLL